MRKFVAPEFIFGNNARNLAALYAKNLGASKVLLVTDPGIIEAGWVKDVTAKLEAENIGYHIYHHVNPNPRETEVEEGVEVYNREKCNLLIAVGGGSPIDCAKGIGIASTNNLHILEFEGVDKIPTPAPPLICVPTTAGSSADISQFCIITNTQEKNKITIISKALVPEVSLIDPVVTTTMSPKLTAHTGLDALTHAIEAYVSNASSPVTDLNALEAINLITLNIKCAYDEPDNLEYRSYMMLASLLAGLAFSNASLGVVHAMAHSLGGFLDSSHGESNAILLPWAIEFNYDTCEEKYKIIGKTMGLNLNGRNSTEKKEVIINRLKLLQEELNLPPSLRAIGLKESFIKQLADKAINDPCVYTNPKKPTVSDIEGIYKNAL
ncbi:MAG: alcohol dehydrogenase [Candidatus Margulisiibacteriota bacterium]|nr:MAG: alcohol dehydrogenase [Candidatus Margulisbacteria bacterium GWD2_39_127]OGI04015.1 MAG: alcohol dehydrogenase [Candidatus Margulisbacteria bacterium GWF2_38_17]OGI06538.1 MAG: alcohol dehydrogenase [Candidatus Margulisbacteria bacterium GWE2_39_32]PZM83207.1 MAG: alcohol dehydrogenase [Candidatus Margulisiibacteriota bacterium]HAR62488.1 alcohol dehydrogenase [Candidatus Margulisiibacteriota bacterium]